jgi:FeS assembly SUF system protein
MKDWLRTSMARWKKDNRIEPVTPSTTSGDTMSERTEERHGGTADEAAKGFCQDEHPHAPVVVPHSLNALVIEAQVIDALETVFDPEIPVNIYELGLIYDVKVSDDGAVLVTMTLTAPSCPAAQTLPVEVEQKVRAIPGVTDSKVEITFDPPWSMEKMSDAARLHLGFM